MELAKQIYEYIEAFFIAYLIGYSIFLLLSVTVGSITLYEQKRKQVLYNYIKHEFYIPISVIVPAHNENITVIDTILSLLELQYRLYEIIVVDDGSEDNTSDCIIEFFKMQQIRRPICKKIPCKNEEFIYVSYSYKVPITLIRKENGGKSDALNMGINASEYPYFVCMDADSMLQSDSLENIARPFLEQSDVIACGGLVRIINDLTIKDGKILDYKLPKSILLCMQILEYDRTFLASRLLFDKFNGNLIVSGAFGLFRKDMVIAVGGYDINTMGEDMELIVRLHAFARANELPYRIRYAANAVCWSQAPHTLHDLKKQRRRWHIGLFQSITKHRQMLFNPVYGMLSFISFIYFLLYELFSPYIELFGLISILLAMFFNLINVPFMILFFGIYALFGSIMSLTAFFSRIHAMNIKLKVGDVFKAISLCVIENVGLRSIMAFTRLTAFIGYKNKKLKWGKIKRQKMNRADRQL
ncbi:glycosyltransferase [Oscillospiraceae bacterium PP1C4]